MLLLSLLKLLVGVALFAAKASFGFVASPLRHRTRPCFFRFHRQNSSPLSSSSLSSSSSSLTQSIEFKLNPSIMDIPAESWDACLDENSSPFLQHSWLRCLEQSKCVSPQTGWVPQHISIAIDGHDRGYVPVYLKDHSMGEFIFDNAWAEAAHQNGIPYYPKLLVGIPFTPATGQRILLHTDLNYTRSQVTDIRRAVGDFLKQVAHANKISSVHVNFLTDEEATDLSSREIISDEESPSSSGSSSSSSSRTSVLSTAVQAVLSRHHTKDVYLRRTSLQYHWKNSNANNDGKPYDSFEDYLSCFKSKRRIAIRRERQKVQDDEGIQVDAIVGTDILAHDGLVERMYELYVSTVDKLYWGRQYLNLEFFQLLAQSDFVQHLCFMCARLKTKTGGGGGQQDDENNNVDEKQQSFRATDVFAGTFNIVKGGVFYGRYWGALAGRQVKNLHFETCYWKAIDYCIQHGLKRMEPGAGGGEYKWARGFDPCLIHSVHYICNKSLQRAISQFLEYETESNFELSDYLMQRSVVGSKGNNRASST